MRSDWPIFTDTYNFARCWEDVKVKMRHFDDIGTDYDERHT